MTQEPQASVSTIQAPEDYGFRLGLIVSVTLHLLVLGLGAWFSVRDPSPKPEPMTAMRVKLGGPKNLELGGKKRKAPVAGVLKTQSTPPKKKDPPKKNRSKPKAKEKQIGLKKTNQPKKKTQPKPTPEANDKVERQGRNQPDKAPPKEEEKGPRAVGGLGGDTGVAVEVGDGSEDINLEDIEFITYFKMVQAQLSSRWANQGLHGGQTKVRFSILRNGDVEDVDIAKSSGLPYLDSPARRAVMGADFPPLPQSYEGDKLIVNIIFKYKD